jgi:integrase
MTVAEWLDRWLPSMKVQVRPTTWENYRTNVRAYIVPGIGDVRLQDLSASSLNALYAELLAGTDWRDGRKLSVKSVRNVHALLSKALSDAMKEERINRNVAEQAPPRLVKVERPVWTRKQMNTFLAATRDDRLAALWRLACRTGARRGELLAITWDDLDLDNGSLQIGRQLVIVGTESSHPRAQDEAGSPDDRAGRGNRRGAQGPPGATAGGTAQRQEALAGLRPRVRPRDRRANLSGGGSRRRPGTLASR